MGTFPRLPKIPEGQACCSSRGCRMPSTDGLPRGHGRFPSWDKGRIGARISGGADLPVAARRSRTIPAWIGCASKTGPFRPPPDLCRARPALRPVDSPDPKDHQPRSVRVSTQTASPSSPLYAYRRPTSSACAPLYRSEQTECLGGPVIAHWPVHRQRQDSAVPRFRPRSPERLDVHTRPRRHAWTSVMLTIMRAVGL